MLMESYSIRLLGAGISTVLALLLGGWLLPKQPASSMGSDWFWSNKVQPKRQFEVVAVGDSRMYRGFSPDDFAQAYAPDRTVEAFNFGFSSAGLDTALLQAAAALLDTSLAQPLLLVGITTSSLANENLENKQFWQEQNRPAWEVWQRKNINPHLTFFDPSSPNTIRNQLKNERQGYYQKYYNNGWIASEKYPHTPWESYAHVKNTYPHVEFGLDVRKNLLQQMAQWQAQGIQVVAFRPPAAPHLEEVEMLPEYYPEVVIKAEIEALGGIWLELPNTEQYITYDGNHLIEASARQWSRDLGKQLQQILQKKKQQQLLIQQQSDFKKDKVALLLEVAQAPKGQQAQVVPAKSFSHTLTYELNQLPLDSLELRAAIWARFPDSLTTDRATLVLSVEDTNGMLLWEGKALVDNMLDPTAWTKVQLKIPYYHQKEGALLKVYLWNNSEQEVLLNHITFEIATL